MASPAPQAPPRWLTRANGLTGLRLLTAPLLALAIVREELGLAHALFWFAVGTDLFDGQVARRYGEVSPLGGLLDHATDASFVTIGLVAIAYMGHTPMLLPPLVMTAFLQYTLDSRALAGQPLRASLLGRWNGVCYFVLLGIPVVRDGLGIGWPPVSWTVAIGWLLVATTLVSMGDRLLALRRSRREA
jgi:phosphatidylglycerophosphate synthase